MFDIGGAELVVVLLVVMLVPFLLALARRGSSTTASVPHDERLRIEAAAILATSGWHTAEAFLREQRGLTPVAAKSLLASLA